MKRPHLPKINWRYAIGELTIVVVGILIALGLNAWWSCVQDHKLETETLRELRTALSNDLVDIRSNIASHTHASNSASLLRQHVSAGSAYADSLDAHFGRVVGATFSIRDEAAYETLKLRGLDTIISDSIRIAIGRVYGVEYPRVVSYQDIATEYVLNQVIPFYNTRFRDLRLFNNATPVDYADLLTSVEFAAHLDWLVTIHSGQAAMMETLESEVETLLAFLDEELASR